MEATTMKHKTYPQALKQEAVRFYRQNDVTYEEVASKFDVPKGTLSNWVMQLKGVRRKRTPEEVEAAKCRYPEEVRRTAAEMLQNQVGSANEIAKTLNVKSSQSVLNWHKKYFSSPPKTSEGVEQAPRTYSEAQVQNIRARYEAQVKDSLTKAEEAMAEAARVKARLERLTKVTALMAKKLGWTEETVAVLTEVVGA